MVALRVEDVAPGGYATDRATIRQKKTRRGVKFAITEQTRQSIDAYLRALSKEPRDYLFGAGEGSVRGLTTRQYARLVARWVASIGSRSPDLRDTLAETDQGHANLSTHRQSSGGPTPPWSHKDREHS
jgi:hypothetical protein